MKRRLVLIAAAVGLVAAACGGGGASCESIADDGMELVQDLIDEIDSMSQEELEAAILGEGFLADFEEKAEEIDDRASEAGCSDEEMQMLVNERAGSLTAETEFGQLLLDGVQSGDFFGE